MKRTTLILGLIGVVLVGVVWWLFLASPKRSDVTTFREERETLEVEETTLRAEKAQLEEIRDNELTFVTAGAVVERLIPPDPQLATFIDDMNLLAQDAGVALRSIGPSLPVPDPTGTFQEIAVSLDVEGQFFELLGFLFGVTDMERLVRVDSVAFSPDAPENGIVDIGLTLEAVIFTTAPPPPDFQPIAGEGGETGEGGDTGDTGDTSDAGTGDGEA